MTEEDMIGIKKFFPVWYSELKPKTVVVLSPEEEYEVISECMPFADIDVCTIGDWNLNLQNEDSWDLCISPNVLHYSTDPALWLENIFHSCGTLWMIDHVDRDRGENQLGDDGDSMRYHLPPDVTSDFPDAFDISLAGEVTKMYTYVNPVTGGAFNPDLQNLSMIAEIKNAS